MKINLFAATAISSIAGAVLLAGQAGAAGLPNGATRLNETYDDWSVSCLAAKKEGASTVNCAIEQVQNKKGTRQRVMAISLVPQSSGTAKGTLLLPFGLDLAGGVTLQVDNGQATSPLPFKTCVPAGCIVPIEWKATTVDGLKSATALKIKAKGAEGKEVGLSISLKGFAGALDRAAALINE